MRPLLVLVALALSTASASAQAIPLVPAGGPPGGSADDVLALDGAAVLLVQDERPFRSTDGGETWTRLRAACLDGARSRFRRGAAGAVYAMFSDHACRSTDGGETWTRLRAACIDGAGRRFRRGADGAVYTSFSDRACRSTDGGATWADVSGTDLRSVFAVRTPHGWFVAAGDTNAVLRSTDEGQTWQRAGVAFARSQWGPTPHVSLHTFPTGEVVAVSMTYGTLANSTALYRWRPDSLRWSLRGHVQGSVFAGLATDAAGRAVVVIRADTYAMYDVDGVLVSTDAGVTWTNVAYTAKAPPCLPTVVRTGADGVVRVGGGCGVHRWNADGSWTAEGALDAPVTGLDSTPGGTLYAASGTRDVLYGPWGQGLYRRSAGGSDWERRAPREATSFVAALSPDGRLAATPVSLWRDDGAAWAVVGGDTLSRSPYRSSENPVGLAWAPWGRALVHTRMTGIIVNKAGHADAGNASATGDAVSFVALGDSTVLSVGVGWGGGLHRSRDRGRTFTPVDSLGTIESLVRRADGRLFAAGWDTPPYQARLWTSTDDGETWARLPTPAAATSLDLSLIHI